MEFYIELGFAYLPMKKEDISALISKQCTTPEHDLPDSSQILPGDKDGYISTKEDSLKKAEEEVRECHGCRLSEGRANTVFGEGNPDARLMFIGEGPGRDEDIQARPFVGVAGKLLTKLILKLGMRREDVYIANIVKCRPPRNRDPEEDEISACMPYVERQVEIIKPEVIVTLGRVATQAFLRSKVPISRLRGSFHRFKDIPVMPTFHPSYLLRNPKDKWLTWDDMQSVLEQLKN